MNEDFESYSIEDEEEKPSPGPDKQFTMWSLLPQILFAPTGGWERVRDNGPLPEIAVLRFLLPISILSGGAEFISLLYPGSPTITGVLIGAVISFMAYFIGYYVAVLLAKVFMPKDVKTFPTTIYGKLLTMTSVASLALFHILYKALPMFDFLLEFLPLWTIFIIYQGMTVAKLKTEKFPLALGVMCVVVIASPVLITWVFSLFV